MPSVFVSSEWLYEVVACGKKDIRFITIVDPLVLINVVLKIVMINIIIMYY